MKKRMVCTLGAVLVVSVTTAFGAVKEGSFTVSPVVGGYLYENDQSKDLALLLGARAGYNFTKTFGIEGVYNYVFDTKAVNNGPDFSSQRYGGQLLYHFFPDSVFVPYVAAGYSGIEFKGNGVQNTKTHGAFDYGVGVKLFLSDDFALRGDVRGVTYDFDPGRYNNVEFTLGACIQFGGDAPPPKAVDPAPKPVAAPAPAVAPPPPPPPPPPAPVPAAVVAAPVVVPPPPADADKDGVIDTLDKCPGTPAGVAVDSTGCPIDSDRDRVADYLDRCPGTPAGVAVDASGCPIDNDKDRVADYLDACPNTPEGVNVDQKGCPLDTDKDGVADYLDKCPDTAAGTAVGANGCPLEAAKKFCDNPAVIEVAFDTGKADLKEKYHDELDKIGSFLKEFPGSKGTISGHTDAAGSKEVNMKLSQARAESVRNYIVSKFGIEDSRIAAKGYGPDKPIASNKTAAGKAKNRRIEAAFTCE
jgi:OOP family OmpA-OmpF porin